MSTTIDRRIAHLEAFRQRQELRKAGPVSFVEEVRRMLHAIDGQEELGMLPGEDIEDVMTRRTQTVDGYDLSGMPGDTLKAKRANVDAAYHERIVVSPEARHAARAYFKLFSYV